MLPSFARQSVDILTPVMVDDHGTETADWSQAPASVVTVLRCSFQPGSGQRDDLNRAGAQSTARCFFPAGTAVNARQHVRYKGHDYEIVGVPEDWEVDTAADHVLVQLNRWEG